MQGSPGLNLKPDPAKAAPLEWPRAEDEFTRTRNLLEEARSDLQRTRLRIDEQQVEHESNLQRTRILSIVLCILVVILAGAFWFAYPAFRDQKKTAMDALGLQTTAKKLNERMNATEGNLNKMSSGLPGLGNRLSQLEATTKTNLQADRDYAQTTARQVGDGISARVNQSIQAIQSRLSGLESNQKESSERVNQLQEQIAGLQRELTTMREEASAATARIKELNEAQQSSTRV